MKLLHLLLRPFASSNYQAIQKGMDIYAITNALGHASLNQTEVYLADLNTEEMDKAFDGFYD